MIPVQDSQMRNENRRTTCSVVSMSWDDTFVLSLQATVLEMEHETRSLTPPGMEPERQPRLATACTRQRRASRRSYPRSHQKCNELSGRVPSGGDGGDLHSLPSSTPHHIHRWSSPPPSSPPMVRGSSRRQSIEGRALPLTGLRLGGSPGSSHAYSSRWSSDHLGRSDEERSWRGGS